MAKRKKSPKLKSKKLEERIAPGMLGGGIIDPGAAAELADVGAGEPMEGDSGDCGETQHDESHDPSMEGEGEGQYLDDAADTEQLEAEANADGDEYNDGDNHEIDDSHGDEFYDSADAGSDFEEPGQWSEPDWVTANADGSYDIQPPEGVSIDDGMANFTAEAVNDVLPVEGATMNVDGSMDVPLPEGSSYDEGLNALVIPEGAEFPVPDDVETFTMANGSECIPLPDAGVEYDVETNSINVSNEILNEECPDNVDFHDDGSMSCELPHEGVEYNDDGSLCFSEAAGDYMDNPPPEYVGEMDCCEWQPDGSATFEVPEGCEVDGGIATIDHGAIADVLPIDENIEFNQDGTMNYSMPDDCQCDYNHDTGALTVSAEFDPNVIPDQYDYHENPDGSYTAQLDNGIDYNADSNCLEFSNECANELLPDNMALAEDGSLAIALPEATEFYEDGSFNVPQDQLDFIEQDCPDFVHECDWAATTPDGAYDCNPPEGYNVDPEAGTVSFGYDEFMNDFQSEIPEDVMINADGTMDISVHDATYDDASGTLTFAEGDIEVKDIPSDINYEVVDGSVKVELPEGINYDAEAQTLHVDNYWTGELIQDNVDISPAGEFTVDLPSGTEYGDDGSFHVPEHCADFMEYPEPDYCCHCDVMDYNVDGSINVPAVEGLQYDVDNCEAQFDANFATEHFDHMIPDDVSFNPDGTMDINLPNDCQYDDASGVLHFPEGSDGPHPNEIPDGINYDYNPDGSLDVTLPEGINYDADAGCVHVDNYWTGEMTPDCVEYTPEGEFHVDLPSDTYYGDDGSCCIPDHCTDFYENPEPSYAHDGPDWVSDNPDGSITVEVPEGVAIDAEAGTMTMDHDVAMEAFAEEIPDDFTFNTDGTLDVSLPEGTDYNADAHSITFPEGEGPHPHELPGDADYQILENGSMELNLPEGIDYNADTGSLHFDNEMANDMLPEELEYSATGQMTINLPEDTQYFEDQGSFVISAESADFMDDHPHDDYHDHGDHIDDGGQAAA